MTDIQLVLVNCPSSGAAANLARTLVEERLAACGNVFAGVRSIYRWEGKMQEDQEATLLLKCTVQGFEALKARIVSLHPYTVPEVLAIPIQNGHLPYLDWVRSECA
jgi:periplasmic divalent cation tolerance protein